MDGVLYNATVQWGLFGQRWYLHLTDASGNLIFHNPVVGSDTAIATSALSWSEATGSVTVVTSVPHGIVPFGSVARMTLSGCFPVGYNGTFDMIVASPTVLTYPQTTDPGGPATTQGTVVHNIDISGGYFNTSTLVFRQDTQTFEVNP